eukprot:362242_1
MNTILIIKWNDRIYYDRSDAQSRTIISQMSNHLCSDGELDCKDDTKFDIKNKYKTLKEEITGNDVCVLSAQQWNVLFQLATYYHESDKVKEMACFRKHTADFYDIKHG